MAHRIRAAKLEDLPAILDLERASFEPARLASAASLRRSLTSARQSVWVVEGSQGLDALLVLWHHPNRLRVYDVATHPEARGRGLGRHLMAHAEKMARKAGCRFLSLEAQEEDGMGFRVMARLPHYYHDGCGAVRMEKRLER
ncbi:MAG: GNAT family N-acetyltransferase [Thermoplasmatota archaeon]